jgi:hypothetical protein
MTMRHWLFALPLILCACKPEPKISTYEVKSESAPAAAKVSEDSSKTNSAMKGNATMQAEVASFAEPKWGPIPKTWIATAPNPMRKGSWSITQTDGSKAEIAVTVFPGDVGGDTANVNRWRGQLGLEKVTDEKIKSEQSPISVGNLTGRVYQLASADGKKFTAAVILPKNNATWFFKITGDTAIVKAEKESFLKMVTQTQLP